MEYFHKNRKQRGYILPDSSLNGYMNGNGIANGKSPFPEEIIQLVWGKAPEDNTKDPDIWRRDHFGRYIRKEDYGKRKSRFGWVIDFIIPPVFGGTNSIDNLRPLNWQNKKRRKRYE